MNTVKHWTRAASHQDSGCTVYRDEETGRFVVPCIGMPDADFATLPEAMDYCTSLYLSYN